MRGLRFGIGGCCSRFSSNSLLFLVLGFCCDKPATENFLYLPFFEEWFGAHLDLIQVNEEMKAHLSACAWQPLPA